MIALHANIGIDPAEPREGYNAFVERLKQHIAAFPGPVMLIHGDSHTMRIDHPLPAYANFTRLETYGSPDIGWIRVVVDTLTAQVTAYEPRLMRGW